VESYKLNIQKKMKAKNIVGIALYAVKQGLVKIYLTVLDFFSLFSYYYFIMNPIEITFHHLGQTGQVVHIKAFPQFFNGNHGQAIAALNQAVSQYIINQGQIPFQLFYESGNPFSRLIVTGLT
jgi:hypothetical protein